MYLKLHKIQERLIVAACDEELIDRVLSEGEIVLDLKKYRDFYVGKKSSEKELESALKSFDSANLVGERSVSVALKLGIVSPEDVMYIKGFPYIQIYSL